MQVSRGPTVFVLYFLVYKLSLANNQDERDFIYNQHNYQVLRDQVNIYRYNTRYVNSETFLRFVQRSVSKHKLQYELPYPGKWVVCLDLSYKTFTPKLLIDAVVTKKPIPDLSEYYECIYSKPEYIHLNDTAVTYIQLFCNVGYILSNIVLNNLTMQRYSNLQVFSIEECRLNTHITKAFLAGSQNLLYLNLDDNNVTYIEPQAFDGLPNIVLLILSQNNIQQLPPGIFCNMASLYYLDVSYNSLTTFPVDVFGYANRNRSACNLHSLEMLSLKHNTLHHIPAFGFNFLPNLKVLAAKECDIKWIDSRAFSGLRNLRQLFLEKNYLVTIAEEWFHQMPFLQFLYLNENKLSGNISLQFLYSLNNLHILNLCLNQITGLSGKLHLVSSLKSLKLDWNNFKELDAMMSNSSSISVITISNNKIRNIDKNGLKRLPNLEILDLSFNKLSSLLVNTFDGTPNLALLNLSYNALCSLPNGIFKPLRELQELHLENNRIHNLSPTFFHGLFNLHVLNLRNNSLSFMDEELFYTLKTSLKFDRDTGFRYRNFLRILDISLNGAVVNSNHIKGSFNLEEFWCADNYIGNLSKNYFQHLYKLKYVDVSGTSITYLSFGDHFYNQTNSLEYLDASRNLISNFGFSGFNKMVLAPLFHLNLSHNSLMEIKNYARCVQCYPNLRNFDIAYNNISELPSIWKWDKLPPILNLKHLDVSNNALKLTLNGFFWLFGRLEYIDLSHNRMIDFKKPLFLPGLEHDLVINAKGNLFICTCKLSWYRSRKKEAEFTHCTSPVTGQTMSLTRIPLDEFLCEVKQDCPTECICLYDHYTVEDSSYTYVKCNKRKLISVPSKLPTKATVLNLSYNNFPKLAANIFKSTISLKKLNLCYCGIRHIDNSAFDGLFELKELNLAGNFLVSVEARWLKPLILLRHLLLHDNRITDISNDSIVTVRTLSYLTLHSNKLVTLNPFIIFNMSYILSNVTLGFNPWNCSCHAYDMQEWLRFHKDIVSDDFNVMCSDPQSRPVFNANISKCPTSLDTHDNWEAITFSVSGVFTLFIIVLITLTMCRGEIQVVLHAKYGWRLSIIKEDESKSFDVFVSYSNADESFVVHTLAPWLEQYGFKVFLHYKHFLPGATISENIIDGVHNSKRTLILLSKNFLKSEWCNFEFKTAHYQMITDKRSRVVIILLDRKNSLENLLDSDLKLYLKTNTYIEKNQKLFWERLIFALPTLNKSNTKEVNANRNLIVESAPTCVRESDETDAAALIN